MTSPNLINSKNGDVQINGGQLFNADNITCNTPTSNQFRPGSAIDILNEHIAPGAFLDSNERFDPPRCDLGTRLAIIDRIMDWITNSNGRSSILWLHGPAGAGKSALGQTIAEKCKDLGILAAVFFFSRNAVSAERSDGSRLIATLVYQLIERFPRIRPYIEKRIGRSNRIFDLGMQAQAENILVYPLNKMSKSFRFLLSRLSTIFHSPYPRLFVIDGLDECRYTHMQLEILEVLARAAKDLNLPFRILVASRPESHIRDFFLNSPAIGHVAVKQLDLAHDRSSDNDIRIYLSRRFKEILDKHPLREYIPSEWPAPEAIEKIASRSSGQFIYAATVIKYIQSPKHQPVDRLKVILGMLEVPRNDKPYAALDSLYTLILSSVDDPRVMQIFSVLAIPRTPDDGFGILNTPAIIDKLLFYQPGDTQLILNDFSSIVTFHTKDTPIKHYHASLNDFLLDSSRSGRFSVDQQKTHGQLAHGYLRLIQENTNDRMCTHVHNIGPYMLNLTLEFSGDLARVESDIRTFVNHYRRVTGINDNLQTATVWEMYLSVDGYPDSDIRLYLSRRLREIIDAHPLREYILLPKHPDDTNQDSVSHSFVQIIYASAVIIDIQFHNHSLMGRLKVALDMLPVPTTKKPYAALDALYTLILSSVNDPRVTEIFNLLTIPRAPDDNLGTFNTPDMIDKLLFYQPGDTLLILADFSSIVDFDKSDSDSPIKHHHASLNDFLLDSSRSGILCVDIPKVHETLARGYLSLVDMQVNDESRYGNDRVKSDFVAFVKHCGKLATSISDKLVAALENVDFCRIFDKLNFWSGLILYDAWESGIMEQLFRQLTCSETLTNTITNSRILDARMEICLQATRRDLPEEVGEKFVKLLAQRHFQTSMFCIMNACDCTKDKNFKPCQNISPQATRLSYYVFYSQIFRMGMHPGVATLNGCNIHEDPPVRDHIVSALSCGDDILVFHDSQSTKEETNEKRQASAYTAFAFEANLHYIIFILPYYLDFSMSLSEHLNRLEARMGVWCLPHSSLRRFWPQFRELQFQIDAYKNRTRPFLGG